MGVVRALWRSGACRGCQLSCFLYSHSGIRQFMQRLLCAHTTGSLDSWLWTRHFQACSYHFGNRRLVIQFRQFIL